jgi:hypothetical protein
MIRGLENISVRRRFGAEPIKGIQPRECGLVVMVVDGAATEAMLLGG